MWCATSEHTTLRRLLPFSRLLEIDVDLRGRQRWYSATRPMKRTQQCLDPLSRLLFNEGLPADGAHTSRNAADNHFNEAAAARKCLTGPRQLRASGAVACTMPTRDGLHFFFRRPFLRRFQSGDSQWAASGIYVVTTVATTSPRAYSTTT